MMLPVFRYINYQFFANFLARVVRPRLLGLKYHGLLFQQKVHSRRTACIAGSPFLGPNIIKKQSQQSVHQILNIVLIVDLQGGAIIVPSSELL